MIEPEPRAGTGTRDTYTPEVRARPQQLVTDRDVVLQPQPQKLEIREWLVYDDLVEISRDVRCIEVDANRSSGQFERVREQTGPASRAEERKPLHRLPEMGETLLHLFPAKSAAVEVYKEKSGNSLERLEVFDELDYVVRVEALHDNVLTKEDSPVAESGIFSHQRDSSSGSSTTALNVLCRLG